MDTKNLKGWQYIVYILIKNNFNQTEFKLNDIYEYEPYFKLVYPDNLNIRPKIRQTLQYLRKKGMLKFLRRGHYQLKGEVCKEEFVEKQTQEVVYLLSNDAMPEWIKIGRSNAVNRRLRELYNTSVPLPFRLEDQILVKSKKSSEELEKSIHSIIDTINPELRKNTEAYKREFFKLSVNQGKEIFKLVTKISRVEL